MTWVPDKWQEDLLWHFLRTGDYWCGPAKRTDMHGCHAFLIVGGDRPDLKKLYSIKKILYGNVVRASDYYKGPSQHPWEYLWQGVEHLQDYLEWFIAQWNSGRIIDAHNRRRRVEAGLEAIYENNQYS